MGIMIKASDLYYRYPKETTTRHLTKFSGKPDKAPFNRDDLYEVLPMLGAVMDELGSDEQSTLQIAEEIMIRELPRFIESREDVFDFLVGCTSEMTGESVTAAAELLSRCKAVLLGVAVGDALGAPVEFMTPGEIAAKYGRLDEMVGGGWLRLKPGQVTDDTEMTLCLARGIVNSGGWDLRGDCRRVCRLAQIKTDRRRGHLSARHPQLHAERGTGDAAKPVGCR